MDDRDGNDSFWDEVGGQRAETPVRPAADPLAMYRRPAYEVMQYDKVNPYAEALRERMGWPRRGDGGRPRAESLRQLAARQVAEARAARIVTG